jgi:hypothetical protein
MREAWDYRGVNLWRWADKMRTMTVSHFV